MRRLIAPTLAVIAMLAGVLVAPAASAVEQTSVADTSTALDVEAALDAETAIGDSIQTADLSKFQAGNIISDAVFFDKSTMTEAQIQAFLEKMVPSCRSGYTCLKDWYDSNRGGGGARSPAPIPAAQKLLAASTHHPMIGKHS